MAPEDRDRTFEKALASHLRSGATQPGCLDPELLAAYHERLLAPEQMMSCKQHIASCDRCQEILAQLEATDDLLIETDRLEQITENVVTMPAPAGTRELVHLSAASAVAGPVAVPSRAARVAQSAWRSKALHGANWRWLAPAGLLAAGLLIWIAFHENAPSKFKLAKNTSPAAPASASKPSLPLSTPSQSSDTGTLSKESAPEAASSKSAGDSAAGPATRADESAATRQIPQPAVRKQHEREEALRSPVLDEKKSAARSSSAFAVPSAVPAEPRTRAERDADQPNLSAAANSTTDAGTAQDKLVRKQVAPAPAPTAPAIRKDDAVSAVAANAPPPQTDNSVQAEIAGGRQTPKKTKSEIATGSVQLQRAIAPEGERAPAMRVAKSVAYATVTAPNSTAMWRFASAGLVEHSTDSGSTWAIQPTGVVADLLSASAPSAKICWIVGRNATILRTTDAGSHWTQLSAPTTADITTIFAVNAKQATITTSARESYVTKDAAESWSRVPNP